MKREENKNQTENPCWFCFNNPNIEKHLILDIGKHSYAAMPKGPISFSHILLIPKDHYASMEKLPSEVISEISVAK